MSIDPDPNNPYPGTQPPPPGKTPPPGPVPTATSNAAYVPPPGPTDPAPLEN